MLLCCCGVVTDTVLICIAAVLIVMLSWHCCWLCSLVVFVDRSLFELMGRCILSLQYPPVFVMLWVWWCSPASYDWV